MFRHILETKYELVFSLPTKFVEESDFDDVSKLF